MIDKNKLNNAISKDERIDDLFNFAYYSQKIMESFYRRISNN